MADAVATAKTDLDRQIASVMDCNPLLEDEVIRLCEKVSVMLLFSLMLGTMGRVVLISKTLAD